MSCHEIWKESHLVQSNRPIPNLFSISFENKPNYFLTKQILWATTLFAWILARLLKIAAEYLWAFEFPRQPRHDINGVGSTNTDAQAAQTATIGRVRVSANHQQTRERVILQDDLWNIVCKMKNKLVLGQRSVHHRCIQLGLKTVRSSIRRQVASPILPPPFCYALVYLGHFTPYSQTILSSLTATHCVGEHNVGNQKRPVLLWTSRKTPTCK